MESSEWLRNYIWRNAGFGSLRDIRFQIEDYEPRYDPTVIPIISTELKETKTKRNDVEKAAPRGSRLSGYYSVADYHRLYLSGEISPVAVAKAILPLIRRDTDSPMQYSTAWFEVKAELVMKAARASAKRYKEGKPLGPMDGVPTAVKDEYEMDGYKTCLGSRNDYTATPSTDGASITSWCVKQLEDAGAIIFGKLSMHDVPDNAERNKVLGIPEDWFAAADPGVQRLCQAMIDRLVREHGYQTVPIKIPFTPQGQIAHAMTVLTDGATLLPETKNLTHANKILLALGRTTPSTDYLLAQKLRALLMKHLAYLWTKHPGMVIITPTTACAGWKIQTQSELENGLSDGDKTIRSMMYVWLANFCGLPALTVPAGYLAPEGSPDAGGVADEKIEGKVPVGLMGTGEWTQEHNLLQFGVDAEAVGADIRLRPPIWVDVVAKAREEMKMAEVGEMWGSDISVAPFIPFMNCLGMHCYQ
ncbi:unnamed protein product [Parascedosporium putredinis]|uniref:Amidase domain-containing protein n=1 Tax=Parascedosporium putredinis TaxID=1442378 RepID=A0A9P1MCC0_9PEZI|nr:unnamed protein product [Parascedosporium putredinis]CAI8000346.1 unnamed protein product [Parascedosporium putredinis]